MIADFKKPSPAWTAVTVLVVCAMGLATLTDGYRAESAEPTLPEGRTMEFPNDRSMGLLLIENQDSPDNVVWESLGEAKGVVAVPDGKRLRFQVSQSGAKDLSSLSSLGPDDVQEISFDHVRLEDSQMEHLRGLTGLRLVDLRESFLTDAGLGFLQSLTLLEDLNLHGNDITAEGLENIQGLSALRFLNLHKREIGDAGLARIAGLTSLEELDVEKTGLTDDGIAHLSSFLG